jgi:hypothetical protein
LTSSTAKPRLVQNWIFGSSASDVAPVGPPCVIDRHRRTLAGAG